jgi:hypothetical protein
MPLNSSNCSQKLVWALGLDAGQGRGRWTEGVERRCGKSMKSMSARLPCACFAYRHHSQDGSTGPQRCKSAIRLTCPSLWELCTCPRQYSRNGESTSVLHVVLSGRAARQHPGKGLVELVRLSASKPQYKIERPTAGRPPAHPSIEVSLSQQAWQPDRECTHISSKVWIQPIAGK